MNLQIFSCPESIIFEKIKITELKFGSVPYFYSYSVFFIRNDSMMNFL